MDETQTVNKIPEKDVYTLCFLDSQGMPKQFISFQGNTSQILSEEELKTNLFSDEELNKINQLGTSPVFRQSSQQIHLDDSIRTIKKKIIHELGANNISYEEIYLFANHLEKISLLEAYQQVTQTNVAVTTKGATRIERQLQELENIHNEMDSRTLGQFLMNLKVEKVVGMNTTYSDIEMSEQTRDTSNDEENINVLEKDSYLYEDLLKIIPKQEKYMLSFSLGQKFSKTVDLLYSGNPFDVMSGDGEPVFQKNKKNELYVFENHLLMNYGNIDKNIIYVCLVGDVLDYAIQNNINESYFVDLYFPLLYKKNILNKSAFMENQQNLISQNNTLLDDVTLKSFDIVDMFYNIYYGRQNELPYIDRGIESFDIIIHPDYDIPLPLDIIFKQIHCSKQIPYIKYNPGIRRENMFRLYSEEIAKNGKKIPVLKKSQIYAISKQTGKMRQISLFIRQDTHKQMVELFVDFEYNGNIRVRGSLNKPISVNDLEIIIYNALNPVIHSINDSLERSGYMIPMFDKITDRQIEIVQISYGCKLNIKKSMKFKDMIGCLSVLFDVAELDFDLSKTVQMQFIRVDNYKKMDAIATMITEVLRRTDNREELLSVLMTNFMLDRDAALKELASYMNDHIRIQGQYVNKNVDIVDNPGFPTSFYKSPFDDKLVVKVNKITSVDFIRVLHIYLDTIIRIYQAAESIPESLVTNMKSLCSKKRLIIREEPVENVMATTAIIGEATLFVRDEDEDEEEDEDIDADKFLPEEEEGEQEEKEQEEKNISEIESKKSSVASSEESDKFLPEEESEIESKKSSMASSEESDKFLPEEESEIESKKSSMASSEKEEKKSEIESKKISVSSSEESDKFLPEEEDDEESDNESERFLPSDDDDDDDDETKAKKGGARKKFLTAKPPPEPKREKVNIFTKRIKEREPDLILTKKEGKFSSYSRICPANVNLQPVILTEEEKKRVDEEHPGSYTNALQYGSDPKNPYWYICPRYWCLQNNMPMSEEEVKRGECGGKIIPQNAKTPPPGHFIYEFTDDKYHKDEKGEYIYHSPGFKPEHSHPNKLCLPCCYNKWSSYNVKNPSEQQRRREQCGLVDHYIYTDKVVDEETGEREKKLGPDGKPIQQAIYPSQKEEEVAKDAEKEAKKTKKPKKEGDEEKQRKKANIFGVERIPIPQFRWGFLPLSIELFLHTDNSKFVTKNNPALIQPHARPLLRYGIEYSQHQSFVALIADIYAYHHGVPLPTVANMREIIATKIDLDTYLRIHNGSLVTIFKPDRKPIDDILVEKYKNTEFYKSIDLNIPAQYRFLQDTVSSFENFLSYLRDDDSMIDHTYLWDIISSKSSPIFNGGLNMVILRIFDNDATDNVELICPTSAYSENIYVKDRGTIMMILHNDIYEPIYLYGDYDKESFIPPVKIFTKNAGTLELKQVQKIFENIMEVSDKKCRPIHKRPRIYEYKENISADKLQQNVAKNEFKVVSQVMNYRAKIIGLVVDTGSGGNGIFLPCFPSGYLLDIPKIYIDQVKWSDYVTTRDTLIQISQKSKSSQILCKPLLKVVEDGLIVGILTETNQFVFIDPPTENLVEDGLPVMKSIQYKDRGYFTMDSSIATERGSDDTRVTTVRNIAMETQFYTSFRSVLRNLLNDYLYRNIRQEILDVLENPQLLYTVKVKKIVVLLRTLAKENVQFVDDIDPSVQKELGDKIGCTTHCDVSSYCMMAKNKICIPKKHMVSGVDNEMLYFSRAADELVRYKRIQLFMLEPRRYLNITNIDYSINEDEFIILASVLTDEYFENLIPYNKNKYVKNITYENAVV